MPFTILGLGTAVPAATLNQEEAQKIAEMLCCRTAEQATFIPAIYAGSGIVTRHICFGRDVVRDVLDGTRFTGSPFLPTGDPDDRGPTTRERMAVYEKEAPELALRASAKALSESGILPAGITHLVTVSCTGFTAPGFDIALINELGLSQDVQRTHVGFMGCHAALNGLRVANAYAGSDPAARVLVCAVELCSLHYHYGWDPPKVVANALFADGAGAVVGTRSRANGAWRLIASGSHLVPEAAEAMTWTIGDHGFGMTLSKKIPELIAANLRPWLEGWLGKHGLRVPEVRSWAVHPGGPKILDAVGAALGLPAEAVWASREVLAEHGNMSSATVLFILQRLIERGASGPCVAVGFGPGLNVEVALFVNGDR
jgi:predicted naringenin-chalcone synthase